MNMSKKFVLITAPMSFLIFAAILELAHPAPKASNFCQQPSCENQVLSQLVVAREDYSGNLVPYLGISFVVALIMFVTSTIIKGANKFMFIGVLLLADTTLYAIMNRFVVPFSRWPSATWIGVLVSTIILLLLLKLLTPKIKGVG